MRTVGTALAAAVLFLAGAVAGSAAQRLQNAPLNPFLAAERFSARRPRLVIPLPAMPQAVPSGQAVGPSDVIGSPYLHMRTVTYDVSAGPSEIYRFYAPLLKALGYTLTGSGQSCGPMIPCSQSWAFQSGQLKTLVLDVKPMGARSRYSLTLEQIVVPKRPAQSYVPAGVEWLEIRFQAPGSAGSQTKVVTAPALLAQLRGLANALPVKPWSSISCLADGGSAVLSFGAGGTNYVFQYSQACDFVEAPTGIQLWDPHGRLWQAILDAMTGRRLQGL